MDLLRVSVDGPGGEARLGFFERERVSERVVRTRREEKRREQSMNAPDCHFLVCSVDICDSRMILHSGCATVLSSSVFVEAVIPAAVDASELSINLPCSSCTWNALSRGYQFCFLLFFVLCSMLNFYTACFVLLFLSFMRVIGSLSKDILVLLRHECR